MRRCCFCVPVLPGATTLGFLGIILCLLEAVPLVTYIIDFEGFNPIKDHIKQFLYILEDMLRDQGITVEETSDIQGLIVTYLWTFCIVETVMCGIYAFICLLLVVGVLGDMRGLMIPYLVFQMFVIVVWILLGVGATIVTFLFNVVIGAVSAVVLLNVSFLLVYFWVVVQKAYIELGHRDYKGYSPAPTNVHQNYDNSGIYPSAPQHFMMQEPANAYT